MTHSHHHSLPPLTARDSEVLAENRGRFEEGYDPDDVNRVLGSFTSAEFVCVWESYDDAGYGGSSEFVGRAFVPWEGPPVPRNERLPQGPWRRMHPEAWEILFDPEADLDPERVPSLLQDEPFEDQNLDALKGDGFCNRALIDMTDPSTED